MAKKNNNFIPSPYKVVSEYEKIFIKEFNETISTGMFNVIEYISKIVKEKTK